MNTVRLAISKWPHAWTTFKFGCLFSGSELTQQIIIRKIWDDEKRDFRRNNRLPIDWANVGRYAIWGFAIFPHVLRSWYKVLDGRFVGRSWRAIVAKTAIDQTFFPLPILGSFYVFLSALEGKTNNLEEVMEECNTKLWTTLKARYCFMVPAQVILNWCFFERIMYNQNLYNCCYSSSILP
jgi:hypothetical protein